MLKRYALLVAITSLLLLPIGLPVHADEASTSKRFQQALASDPQLIAFLRAMPKGADLHNHVSGAIYAESFLDAAIKSTPPLYFNPITGDFSQKQDGGYTVPAGELYSKAEYAAVFLNAASMRAYTRGATGDSHDHFFNAFFAFRQAQYLIPDTEQLAEVVNRAKAENLSYLEVSTSVAPSAAINKAAALSPELAAKLNTTPPMLPDAAVLQQALEEVSKNFPALLGASRQLLDNYDKAIAPAVEMAAPITSTQGPITLRYITGIARQVDNATFFGRMACAMTIASHDQRVAGITILQAEDDVRARWNFDAQMRIIDFLWTRLGKPNMALHAGELTLQNSPVEAMRSRIRKSIEQGHSRRIGHGVSIAWEDDLDGLLQTMRKQKIAVEICLTSNDLILNVTGKQHPFNLYRTAGIPLTLNTDDEGVSRSNETVEFLHAVRTYNLSYLDLKTLARNSIEYSFLPGDSLYVDGQYGKLLPEFVNVRALNWEPNDRQRHLMDISEKRTLQVRLERAMVYFENK